MRRFIILTALIIACIIKTQAQSLGNDSAMLSPAPPSAPAPSYYLSGDAALRKFIAANIVYPAEARHNNIQGTVILVVKVNKQGVLKNIVVLNGNALLAKEAKRVIGLLPQNWVVAHDKNNNPTEGAYTVPISFKL